MATKLPPRVQRRVYDSPLHVTHGADGTVTIFLPDGHRMTMTANAAERSGTVLWRTGVSQRERREVRRRRSGQVIAVDFSSSHPAD
jgi:hypothetical protein